MFVFFGVRLGGFIEWSDVRWILYLFLWFQVRGLGWGVGKRIEKAVFVYENLIDGPLER